MEVRSFARVFVENYFHRIITYYHNLNALVAGTQDAYWFWRVHWESLRIDNFDPSEPVQCEVFMYRELDCSAKLFWLYVIIIFKKSYTSRWTVVCIVHMHNEINNHYENSWHRKHQLILLCKCFLLVF